MTCVLWGYIMNTALLQIQAVGGDFPNDGDLDTANTQKGEADRPQGPSSLPDSTKMKPQN